MCRDWTADRGGYYWLTYPWWHRLFGALCNLGAGLSVDDVRGEMDVVEENESF
ncbi:hypothetical protein C8R44DRAFT_811146 [Mycena epipterygia]|nr:hypothetical protein C8R44DRAFT_811146 [Mycena epipterygia]